MALWPRVRCNPSVVMLFALPPPAAAAARGGHRAVTVSGQSSGGSMAMQHLFAFSSSVAGAAVAAGSPYACGNLTPSLDGALCSYGVDDMLNPLNVSRTFEYISRRFREGLIDDPANLRDTPVVLFLGGYDWVVWPAVMNATKQQLLAYVPAALITDRIGTTNASHVWPLDNGPCPCGECGYPVYGYDYDYDSPPPPAPCTGDVHSGVKWSTQGKWRASAVDADGCCDQAAAWGGAAWSFDPSATYNCHIFPAGASRLPRATLVPCDGCAAGSTGATPAPPSGPQNWTEAQCCDVNNCGYDLSGEVMRMAVRGRSVLPRSRTKDTLAFVDQTKYLPYGLNTTWKKAGVVRWALVYVPTMCEADPGACQVHVHYHGCAFRSWKHRRAWATELDLNAYGEANGVVIIYPQAGKAGGDTWGCWNWDWPKVDPLYDTQAGAQLRMAVGLADDIAGALASAEVVPNGKPAPRRVQLADPSEAW